MKDLLIRILVSSLVGAIVSAGIMYFAFDQSMRGMEKAIDAVGNHVSENGEWIRTQNNSLSQIQSTLDEKLGDISAKIEFSAISSKSTIAKYSLLQKNMNDEILITFTITSDILGLFAATSARDAQNVDQILELIERLKVSQEKVRESSRIIQTNFIRDIQPVE